MTIFLLTIQSIGMPLIVEIDSFFPSIFNQKNNQLTYKLFDHFIVYFSRRMWEFLQYFFLIGHFQVVVSSRRSIGIVRNATMMALNMSSIIINGTCRDCLCSLASNEKFSSSFNCFSNNNTCEVILSISRTRIIHIDE